MCGPGVVLCSQLQAHCSCFLRSSGAFYIYPKHFPTVFIFYSVRYRKQLPLSLWWGDLYGLESLFCCPTCLILGIILISSLPLGILDSFPPSVSPGWRPLWVPSGHTGHWALVRRPRPRPWPLISNSPSLGFSFTILKPWWPVNPSLS